MNPSRDGMKPSRPIDTTAHRKDRARYFRAHPICERCDKVDRATPAFILHHRDGDQSNRAWENFEALCNDCHEVHHGRKGMMGCDVNGLPISAGHPWAKGGRDTA
jgi:hypothetical protein